MRVAVLGATGKTGRPVVTRLCDDGHAVTAVGRASGRLAAVDERAEHRLADLERPETVAPALAGAECVVSLAHAGFIKVVLGALPASCCHVVLTGSARRFTRLPDPAADAVRAGEAAFRDSAVPGVLLHPTMIYGAPDERNVQRILGLIRRWPRWLPLVLPLPDGGRHTVQPVYFEDVVETMAAAVRMQPDGQLTLLVPGPAPIRYAELVRACGRALGRAVRTAPAPLPLLVAVAALAGALRLPFPVRPDELRRACEDKAFDAAPLTQTLGVAPRPLEDGLAAIVERG